MRKETQALIGKANLPQEPSISTGSLVSVIVAILTIISTLFPHLLSPHTSAAIFAMSAIMLPLITSILIRRKVWSPASVQNVIDEITAETSQIKKVKDLPTTTKQTPKLL